MLRFLGLGLLLSIAHAASATASANAQVALEDFEADHEWHVIKSEENGAACEVVASPMRQGNSLKITWGTDRAKYCEPHLVKFLPVPGFDQGVKPYHGRFEIDVFSPGTSELRLMSVRLLDSHNEAFQWMRSVDLSDRGWQTITFELRPDNTRSNWGGQGGISGQMDGAVRLMGITIDFDHELEPPADPAVRQIIVDNLVMQLPGGGVPPEPTTTDGDPTPGGAVDLDAVKIGLDTGHRMHIVDPVAPQPAYLTLHNEAGQPQAVRLSIKARSMLGRRYELDDTIELKSDGQAKQFLPLPQDRQDFWWVYYTLSDPRGALPERYGREMLGMMTPGGMNSGYQPQDRFLFGMCAHTGRYDDQTMQDEAYAAGLIGLDIMRTGASWMSIQPDGPDSWEWSKMDRIVQLYRDQNIELQRLLTFSPKWASTGDLDAADWRDWGFAAPRREAWVAYVRACVQRYQDDIRHWELWNEPDLDFFRSPADDYVALCDDAYQTIKSIDPAVTVLSGGFSGIERKPGFLDDVMPRVRDDYDVLAVHIHGGFGEFQKAVDGRWNQLHQQYASDKPIYYNETGISSPRDTIEGDTRQAVVLVKKVTFAMARGAIAYNWYDLRNDGDDPNDHENRFGVITRDFRAKPAYVAYNNLIRQLRGFRFVQQIETDADRWLFLFEKDDRYMMVGWAEQPYAVGQLVVQTDAAQVQRIDMLGNAETTDRLPDGGVILAIDSDPTYWLFDNTQELPRWRDDLLNLASVPAFVPGRANALEIEFTNPLSRAAKMSFEVTLPPALGSQVIRRQETLAAKATQSLHIPVEIARTDVDYGKPFTCMVSYYDADYQLQGTTPVMIRWAGVIHDRGFSEEPTFVLNQDLQVVDLYGADPNTKDRVWQGPSDLSAKAWLAATPTHLKVRVAVEDDAHVQHRSVDKLWASDSVQLVLLIPGQAGQWELCLARQEDGHSILRPDIVPPGLAASAIKPTMLATAQDQAQTVYELDVPLGVLGLDQATLRQGISLSLLVNDDDGQGRDGWIALSGGIGDSKDPTQYPFFVVE